MFRLMKSATAQQVTKVAILTVKTFASIPIIGPMDMLNKSCAIWRRAGGGGPSFDVELVSLTAKPIRFGSTVTLHPHASIVTARRPDLVIIPSLGDDLVKSLDSNRGFVPWIKSCSAEGARVVSLCTGAFLLAATGLLDGRAATTHWCSTDLFRKLYPKVDLQPERLIVDEGNVITSGAATFILDVVLYLIGLYCGREAAILCAKIMLVEMGRHTQLPYTIFSTKKRHNDRQIMQVQHLMESQTDHECTIEALARRAHMGVRNFDRRFRQATGESPSSYLQKLRVEKAKRLLENTNDTIEEIIRSVGYEDHRSFRRLFKTFTSLSPKAYRLKYGMLPERDATARRQVRIL